MRVLVEADVIENEKLRFRAEKRGVADAGILQIQLGLFGDPARVAFIILLGERIAHIADHHQRRRLHERIHESGLGIGNEQHVALIDRRPAADAGAIDAEAIGKRALVQFPDRIRNMVLQARDIGEPDIDLSGAILFRELQNFSWCHLALRLGKPQFIAPRSRVESWWRRRFRLRLAP